MNIKENLINFLYDKNYFITIYQNYIHIFNYKDLIMLTEKKIVLKLENFELEIKGENLYITKMLQNELLIKGTLKNVGFKYE